MREAGISNMVTYGFNKAMLLTDIKQTIQIKYDIFTI